MRQVAIQHRRRLSRSMDRAWAEDQPQGEQDGQVEGGEENTGYTSE
jgi:hypothetical protein